MRVVSVEELVNHKILPFDIFNDKGKKIFGEGEVLTPGKILQLKYIPAIYIKDDENDVEFSNLDDIQVLDDVEVSYEDDQISAPSIDYSGSEAFFPSENRKSVISPTVQKDLKNKYKNLIDSFIKEGAKDPSLYLEVRDSIIEEVLPEVNRILFKSQLKVFGDYYYSHGVNVAMLSTVLAHKMKLTESQIKDITLAAMLHDIGKTKIPRNILDKTNLTPSENKLIQLHPRLGYNIIKNDLGLSEEIAKVAFQHHERCDGSGYPYGISGDMISLPSHIVMICNFYDDLTSGKGPVKVKNAKEAMKFILENTSKLFKRDVFYTFVHMTNYNDLTPLPSNNNFV